MQKRPVILISNDDGIEAKGIQYLTELMKEFGNVYVVAPQQHQSGMAHAITFKVPLRAKCICEEENLHIYSVNGTPVDCVKFGFDQLLLNKKIDLVISGINHGSNSANSIIYSGTAACAREGAINGIPSIAFSSLDFSEHINFEPYKPYIEKIVKHVLEHKLDKHIYLNVNFPKPEKNIKGMRVCHLTKGLWIERFIKEHDPRNNACYWLTGEYHNEEPDCETSDEWCLAHDYIAIVPVKVENSDEKSIQSLSSLNTL
ncbi:MAG: 5'/3'-nucleotidase SurE [Bacteroidales bacterium]|nr:5'/3'-nucleotidase SurE [Bacteroidales bacterium]